MSTAALTLRCLIRNDEALVEHLAARLQPPTPEDFGAPEGEERAALLTRLGDRIRTLQLRRCLLASLSPATAPAASKSCITADSGHALQPTGEPSRPVAGE